MSVLAALDGLGILNEDIGYTAPISPSVSHEEEPCMNAAFGGAFATEWSNRTDAYEIPESSGLSSHLMRWRLPPHVIFQPVDRGFVVCCTMYTSAADPERLMELARNFGRVTHMFFEAVSEFSCRWFILMENEAMAAALKYALTTGQFGPKFALSLGPSFSRTQPQIGILADRSGARFPKEEWREAYIPAVGYTQPMVFPSFSYFQPANDPRPKRKEHDRYMHPIMGFPHPNYPKHGSFNKKNFGVSPLLVSPRRPYRS